MARARRDAVDAAFDTVLGKTGASMAAIAPHPGLLLQRGLPAHGKAGPDDTHGAVLLRHAVECPAGDLYRAAYRRWEAALSARPALHAARMEAQPALIVGLGGAGVLETAITLNHTYGTPLIPGSALKGLARHFVMQVLATQSDAAAAADLLKRGGDYQRILFGTTEDAGHVTYHDAWYIPDSAPEDRSLRSDVITVHHPAYYTGGDERRAPWDFDDPNPVPFVSARGCYLVAVEGPNPEWSRFALEVLILALADYGAGGKTSSGYGRLIPTGSGINYPESTMLPGASAAPLRAPSAKHPMVAQIDALNVSRVKPEIGNYVSKWRELADQTARLQVARAIMAKLEAMHDPKWVSQRAGVRELRDCLDGPEGAS